MYIVVSTTNMVQIKNAFGVHKIYRKKQLWEREYDIQHIQISH